MDWGALRGSGSGVVWIHGRWPSRKYRVRAFLSPAAGGYGLAVALEDDTSRNPDRRAINRPGRQRRLLRSAASNLRRLSKALMTRVLAHSVSASCRDAYFARDASSSAMSRRS